MASSSSSPTSRSLTAGSNDAHTLAASSSDHSLSRKLGSKLTGTRCGGAQVEQRVDRVAGTCPERQRDAGDVDPPGAR